MNLSDLDPKAAAAKGAVLQLRNPFTGDPIGASITLMGKDAPKVVEAHKEAQRRVAAGEIDNAAAGIDVLVAATIAWENIGLDGENLECTPENARKVYTDERTEWVAEQAVPFSLSRRNYAPSTKTG